MAGIAFIPLLLFMFATMIESCCYTLYKYPNFLLPPDIILISLTKVKVSWAKKVENAQCIDWVFVYYWKTIGGNRNDHQRERVKGKDFAEIRETLEEDTVYSLQIDLVEDDSYDPAKAFCTITNSDVYNFETGRSGTFDKNNMTHLNDPDNI